MMTRFAIVAGALIALLASRQALAQDAELSEILDSSIITTASQLAETASNAPATSTCIDSDELQRYGIRTLEEAINFLALGVSSTGGKTALNAIDLGARGVALANDQSSHFLLLIDGHSLNEPFLGAIAPDHGLGLPLEAVDRIEVIVGPGSVLYGSNAMLGVINIVTKGATRARGGHAALELVAPVGERVAAYGAGSFELFGERATLSASTQYWHEHGPDFRLGPQNLGIDPFSGRPIRTTRGGPESGVWGGRAERASFAHAAGGMLRLRVGRLELALRGVWERKGQPFTAHDFDDPETTLTRRSAALDVKYSRLLTPQLRLGVRAYGDGFDLVDRVRMSSAVGCAYAGVNTCKYEGRVVSRWLGTEAQLTFDWTANARLTTLLGVDARLRSIRGKQDVSDDDTGEYLTDSFSIVDSVDRTLGVYAQQIWWPLPELVLNAGARLDREPRFEPVISPRVALSLSAWQGAVLRAIYSEAFRAPGIYQSEYGDPLMARADQLAPERVRSVEASIEQHFGPHRLFFGVFRSAWRDLVEVRFISSDQARVAAERGLLPIAIPGVAHTQHQNAASIDSYGFNAGAEGRLLHQRLRYGLNVTEAYSRRDGQAVAGAVLPTAPRLISNARVAFELPRPLPTLALAGYLLTSRLVDRGAAAGFSPTPYAPTQVDLRATATGSIPFTTGWSYALSADRVLGNQAPYAIGSLLDGTPENRAPELGPIAPFRVFLGLHYDIGED